MIELIGYVAVFGGGGWLTFMAGFIAHHFIFRRGLEGFVLDLAAGLAALAVWVVGFIWWLA